MSERAKQEDGAAEVAVGPVPTWRTFDGLPAIFADCADSERGVRYCLTHPWVADDGFLYATNGRILVRLRAEGVREAARWSLGDRKVPGKPWDALDALGPFHVLPTALPADARERVPCEVCGGKPGPVKCDDCEGSGRWADIDDTTYACETCEGRGHFDPCWSCEGHPQGQLNGEPVPVGDGRLAGRYAGLLLRHGVAEVFELRPQVVPSGNGTRTYRAFRFALGEVEGVVMGMDEATAPREADPADAGPGRTEPEATTEGHRP